MPRPRGCGGRPLKPGWPGGGGGGGPCLQSQTSVTQIQDILMDIFNQKKTFAVIHTVDANVKSVE